MEPDLSKELLFELSSLALKLSDRYCHTDMPCGNSCRYYHGFWPYLRALKVISGIEAEDDFFVERFRSMAGSGRLSRALISGCADSGMLELLIRAIQLEGKITSLNVLDECETPLRLNQRYAKYQKQNLKLIHSSIFDYETWECFDLICTHSFLSYIHPDRHLELFNVWYKLLTHGGQLVTSQSFRPKKIERCVRFTSEQAKEFSKRVEQAAWNRIDFIEHPVRLLGRLAEKYARNKGGYALKSPDLTKKQLEKVGFNLKLFAPAGSRTHASHLSANPDARKSWIRYQIVATK